MNPGSTEVFLALSTALRNQLQIKLLIPQHPPIPATIQALSSDYTDVHCISSVLSETQLQLVRLEIPSRNGAFSVTTHVISINDKMLRLALHTDGVQKHPLITEALNVQTEKVPQLKKVHSLLHHLRDGISPWAEHRIAIELQGKRENAVMHIQTNHKISRIPEQFCFPVRPFEKQSRYDIQVPIRLQDRVFGYIAVILAHDDTIDLPERLSELSVYAASLAYGLVSLPEPSETSYLLMSSKYGSLYFRSSPQFPAGCAYPVPLNNGYCFSFHV
ncbi:hypothetical protein [Spirochaeta dissipatitropha]